MPIPTKSWSDIGDAQVDAESPLDTTLMTQIRDNLVNIKEWLGQSYTPVQDHDHDGVNSKSVALADGAVVTVKLAGSSVTLAKLKMAHGSWSGIINSDSQVHITLNRYSHIYQSYANTANFRVYLAPQAPFTNWQNGIAIYNGEIFQFSAGLNWDYHLN
jgi:hypothetical protein